MVETETSSSEAVFLKLLQKNAFDPLTFLLELEITQAKVTDLATATVNDLQQLLNGLTTNPAQGIFFREIKFTIFVKSNSQFS